MIDFERPSSSDSSSSSCALRIDLLRTRERQTWGLSLVVAIEPVEIWVPAAIVPVEVWVTAAIEPVEVCAEGAVQKALMMEGLTSR